MWAHSSTDSNYTAWAPNRPSTVEHNIKDCVLISLADEFLWRDVPCYKKAAAAPICQRDVDLEPETTPAETSTVTSAQNSTTPFSTHVELRDSDGYRNGNVFTVNRNGYLGPVCDDRWSDTEARIVCKQLGFTSGTKTSASYFGNVPDVFAMDEVNCGGSEATLQECDYRDHTQENCGTHEGAGVKCT